MITALFLPSVAFSRDFSLLDVESAGVKAAYFGCNRDPMTPHLDRGCEGDYKGRVAFELNLRLLEVGYWDNDVHTEGIDSQVKTVGWHWETGLHITKKFDLFYEHHSRHVMEGLQPRIYDYNSQQHIQQKFPLEDSYGLRLKFYINPNPARSMFGD